MTDRTPLEKLDDAVHEYIKETTGEDPSRSVAGWALGIETTALVFEENALPLADAQHYVFGPQTTISQAVGLGRFVANVLEQHIVNRALENED
jgi:hypothetical protein